MVKDFYNVRTSKVDGILQFEWDEYLGSDFEDYGISVGDNMPYHINETTYQALGHIGQMKDYAIWVNTDTTWDRNILLGYETFFSEFPDIKRSLTDSGTYVIYWDKPKYYGALEKIQLWEENISGDTPNTLVKETDDFNDTLYHVKNVEHNQRRMYGLTLYGKYPRDPFHPEPETGSVYKAFTYLTQ